MKLRKKDTGAMVIGQIEPFKHSDSGADMIIGNILIEFKSHHPSELMGKYQILERSEMEDDWIKLFSHYSVVTYYRVINGQSQSDISKITGIPQTQLSRYERGILPSPKIFYKLADALKVDPLKFYAEIMERHLYEIQEKQLNKYLQGESKDRIRTKIKIDVCAYEQNEKSDKSHP